MGGGPGTPGGRPLGEIGCFGRLFWDPTPPNLEFRIEKKTPERQYGDLSNALSLVGRAPVLSWAPDRFWVTKVRSGQGSKQGTKQQQASKQQQQQQATTQRDMPPKQCYMLSICVLNTCYMLAKCLLNA